MRWALILGSIAGSAALLAASMPSVDLWPLAWFALTPTMVAVRGKSFVVGFVAGLLVSVGAAFVLSKGWFSSSSYNETSPAWIFGGLLIFGLVFSILAGLAAEVKRFSWLTAFNLAAGAAVLEAFSLVALPVHLGLTQYRNLGVVSLASVTGIWGVSFAVWAANCLLVAAMETRRLSLGAIAVAIPLALTLQPFRLGRGGRELGVGAIQTEAKDLATLASLNAQASRRGAAFVVWPELSAQSIPNRELLILAREPGQAPFLTTFPDQVAPLPHNVLAMFSRDGESAHYFKRKPFAAERSMHAAGSQPVSVSYLGTRIGLGICFDECYPAVMRELANDTLPDVIAIPSLDPATPYGVIQAMHGAFTPFRAAELGTPFVRSEITGYSQIVERDGMIVGELAAGREGMMVADIHLGSRHTVYRTLGDWFLYLCALSLATQGLRQVIRKRRQVIADRSRSPLETS